MIAYDRIQVEKDFEILLKDQSYFYIVEEGEIELSGFIDNQKRVTDIIGRNEIFGTTILQENDNTTLSATALSSVSLIRIAQDDLIKWSKMQSSFNNALTKILFFNIQKLRDKIKNINLSLKLSEDDEKITEHA
jgi:CRP-like cAMP-binding protein